ncbi:MAG: hypothetical protein GF401_08645, partial [Chitinivibrionales bacterium]|nr:hypothetical protein [Chitinivibrionales bacterium]
MLKHPLSGAAHAASQYLISAAFIFVLLISGAHAQVVLTDGGNSITVPKEKMHVYVFIGHSNMVGRGSTPDSCRDFFFIAHPRCWNFHIQDNYSGPPHHEWIPATEPVHRDQRNFETPDKKPVGGGMGMAVVREMASRYPNHYFGIIQNADGGTSVGDYAYNRSTGSGANFLDQVVDAINAAKGTATIAGIIAELANPTSTMDGVNNFIRDIQLIADKIRQQTGLPDTPFLVSQFRKGYYRDSHGDYAVNLNYTNQLVIEIENLPNLVEYCAVIPTDFSMDRDKYMHDHSHYNLLGMIKFGKNAADVIVQNSWAPATITDTHPPLIPSGLQSGTITPMSITLQWNASSDNDAVKEYLVFLDNTLVARPAA